MSTSSVSEVTTQQSILENRNILIVDDEEPIRRLLGYLLEPHGYKVSLAGEGEKTLTVSSLKRGPLRSEQRPGWWLEDLCRDALATGLRAWAAENGKKLPPTLEEVESFESDTSSEAFARVVAELHAQPLDRSRPLWQFTVIHGLATGEIALYTKVHHALLDGVTAMKTMRRALSTDPQDTDLRVPWGLPPRTRSKSKPRSSRLGELARIEGLGADTLRVPGNRRRFLAAADAAQIDEATALLRGRLLPRRRRPTAEGPGGGRAAGLLHRPSCRSIRPCCGSYTRPRV